MIPFPLCFTFFWLPNFKICIIYYIHRLQVKFVVIAMSNYTKAQITIWNFRNQVLFPIQQLFNDKRKKKRGVRWSY